MSYSNKYTVGESAKRPWGQWAVIAADKGYAVKKIEVEPGHSLSLQKHEHRAEHWVIVQGEALVTVERKTFPAHIADAIFISKEFAHRIANSGEQRLVFIEVQIGTRLFEDDIKRLEDNYGRG